EEQKGIHATLDGFQDLPFIDEEILAQQRQLYRLANLAEVMQRTLKKFFVGEDRQTTCPGRLVLPGDPHRVEVRANQAGRRRRPFHFGDERDVAGARLVQGRAEVAPGAV